MKKMMKQFFVAVVASAAFTACSDSNYVGEESETPSQFANQAMNTAILTDVNGQQLSSVSGDFGNGGRGKACTVCTVNRDLIVAVHVFSGFHAQIKADASLQTNEIQ